MAEKRPWVCEQSYILRPEHMNCNNRLFGGHMMMWIDDAAGVAARRYCGRNITTACVDNLDFLAGAFVNETIVLYATVTYVGRTSMEVTVHTYSEKLDGSRTLINVAHLVEVALDDEGKACRIEPFVPETEEEKRNWEEGRLRYEARKAQISR